MYGCLDTDSQGLAASLEISRVKPGFNSVPPQFHFEIAGLASAVKFKVLRKRNAFKPGFYPAKVFVLYHKTPVVIYN